MDEFWFFDIRHFSLKRLHVGCGHIYPSQPPHIFLFLSLFSRLPRLSSHRDEIQPESLGLGLIKKEPVRIEAGNVGFSLKETPF